ncbi:hypothetical protein [Shouchella miscanthi]|uniref:hypothetical protein n=1 Tax=Shouchella miscanthi TaxID=2598861 RepID=UPI0011A33A3D|nr:hypothetical protein [Shouchella miscanthi]
MDIKQAVIEIAKAAPFEDLAAKEIDNRPEITIRVYVITRLTREYIHNIHAQNFDMHQQMLKLIADDLFLMRSFFRKMNIRVEDNPSESELKSLHWRYWINGRTGTVGGTKTVLKKNIKETLLRYRKRLNDEMSF